MTGSEASPSFRLAYVPGVTPSKWVRIWNERLPDVPLTLLQVSQGEASGVLRGGGADAGLLRLPADRSDLSAIPLYTETTVVVVPKDHLACAADEVSAEDLSDDTVLHPLDDPLDWEQPPGQPATERPATTEDAVELVAAGVGVLYVPQSLARLYHRRDLTYRPVTGVPESRVALSWREDATTDLVEDFIGIVRGRTVNSSRGRRPSAAAAEPKSKSQQKSQSKSKPNSKSQPKRSDNGGTPRKSVGKPGGKGPRRGAGAPKGGKRGKPRGRS